MDEKWIKELLELCEKATPLTHQEQVQGNWSTISEREYLLLIEARTALPEALREIERLRKALRKIINLSDDYFEGAEDHVLYDACKELKALLPPEEPDADK